MFLNESSMWFLVIPVVIFSIALLLVMKWLEYFFLKKAALTQIDKMSGFTFEKYLSVFFREQGYKVRVTPDRADFGADLIIEKAGVKTAVQAKRYRKFVGIRAVQEVVAAQYHYQCDKAMVVTNSTFTPAARQLAHSTKVELIERNRLEKMVKSMKK